MVKYLALLLAGILAASCIFDADQCVMSADQPHGIMFTVALDHHKTRAAWSEVYPSEDGVAFDYRIIPEDLRVVVYAEDGTRVGVLQDLGYWPINEAHTEFQFVGQLPAEFVAYYNEHRDKPEYKFMVLANCGDHSSGEEYISYSQAQLDPTAANSAIPMWGVKEADVTSLLNSESLDLGTIWLLRAAAKIEVKLSKKEMDKNTKINSATLKYYNQTGYVLPSGALSVADTRNLDQENCFRGYRHAAVNLPFYKDEQTGSVYLYVTEYNNLDYSGERNKISLEFNIKGQNKTFEDAISFCNYSSGKPVENSHYNIVRNHIYEFEVLSIAGDNLELQYTVADWDAERWDTNNDGVLDSDYEEHELAYPTYHNPVVPIGYLSLAPGQIANYTISQQPQMHYNANNLEEGAFECFFQITAPTDVQWKPGIAGSTGNYQIRVYEHPANTPDPDPLYDSSKGEEQGNIGACKADKWYRIVVFPLIPDGAGSTNIDFMITYYQSWTDQYIHLYINGEYDHIRWPNSGTNPKLINIKHVAQEYNTINE
ncbi:MAG: hypothetical protein IKU36_12785 [Bacteroidales bacterium]|nr:hypothetical protein [Bacteroidales bacterium]